MPQLWHVLRTAPQRELAVAGRLGPAAYVPLRSVWRPRWLGRQRRVEDAEAPLLSRYVFLLARCGNWPAVLHTPDVRGVLIADGRPAIVADSELAELRRMARRAPIRPGDVLHVDCGVFAGLDVVASAIDAGRRSITADVTLLGSRRPVRISVDYLAAG